MLALYRIRPPGRRARAPTTAPGAGSTTSSASIPAPSCSRCTARSSARSGALPGGAAARSTTTSTRSCGRSLAGRLVPVLGTTLGAGLGNDDLAALLADRFECPHENAARPRVRVAVRGGAERRRSALGRAPRCSRPRTSSLVRCTAGSRGCRRLLAPAGPSVSAHRHDGLRHRGRACVRRRGRGARPRLVPRDRARPRPVPAHRAGRRPRRSSRSRTPTSACRSERRTVLLKIHGQVDRAPARERESFVVSEDDHIDYLAGADAAGTVPVTLAARLRRSHLLFLGYAVHDWSLRVFLRRVWANDRLAYRSWAVSRRPRPSRASSGASAGSRCTSRHWTSTRRRSSVARASWSSPERHERRAAAAAASPYKGLAPFDDSDRDARFFFGRERETELVAANLMASRLTVLYGPSGVGKSSLLRAGVTRRLRAHRRPSGVGRRRASMSRPWTPGATTRPLPSPRRRARNSRTARSELADALAERTIAARRGAVPVLDQIEEYFLYHGIDDGGPLAGELEEILPRPDLRVHVLLGVRDDALADLDVFKARLPGLFGNVLRLDHLDREGSALGDRRPARGVRRRLGGDL